MAETPVPLIRTFSLVHESEAKSDEQDFYSFQTDRTQTTWQELERQYRCVILAEAGAGKTFELQARAKAIKESGRFAFFFRIEDLAGDFEDAFGVGHIEEFERWLKSQSEAWIFLDSVDEARLQNPRNFENSIRRFSRRIQQAQRRAHLYISSRPYAWRPWSDRRLMERYLPFTQTDSNEVAENSASEAVEEAQKLENALQVYQLDSLDEQAIRVFAECRQAPEVDGLILELQRTNLLSIAARPFDLDGIVGKWKEDQKLDSRLQLLQHNIDKRLSEIHPDRQGFRQLSTQKARQGAQLLAASVLLTGQAKIHIPDSSHPSGSIQVDQLLTDWSAPEIRELLEYGVFGDAIYGAVRFRHREIRELLAAEWFNEKLQHGNARRTTERLFLREQYGQKVLVPRLRPVLSWLVLFDAELRNKALAVMPEVAVEGGDAAQLPLAERKRILSEIVAQVSNRKNGYFGPDTNALARISQLDLADDVLRLIRENRRHGDAIYLLAKLVWQGGLSICVQELSEIALDSSLDTFARVAAAQAVFTCGTEEQQKQLWNGLNRLSAALPRELLAETLIHAPTSLISIEALHISIQKLEGYEQYTFTRLDRILPEFLGRLANTNLSLSYQLIGYFNDLLECKPYIPESNISAKYLWLIMPAAYAVQQLISARSSYALSAAALAILLKIQMARQSTDIYYEREIKLPELVPQWDELNDKLFWESVQQARKLLSFSNRGRLVSVNQVHSTGQALWGFRHERLQSVLGFIESHDFLDDKLVALSLAIGLFRQADKPNEMLLLLEQTVGGNAELEDYLDNSLNPKQTEQEKKWEAKRIQREQKRQKEKDEKLKKRTAWIQKLKVEPDSIRAPVGLKSEQISIWQWLLFKEIQGDSFLGCDWQALVREFGAEVAEAYRDAAMAYWMNYNPGLASDGADIKNIPGELVFAMTGLKIEVSETQSFLENLTAIKAAHMTRYAIRWLNGYPDWFESLYQKYPQIVLEIVGRELYWELANTGTNKLLHYILSDLLHYASWMHQDLINPIVSWLENNNILNEDALCYCIRILSKGNAEHKVIASLAKSKILLDDAKEQLPIWYALWVGTEPESAVPAVEKWLKSLADGEAVEAAQSFIVGLIGKRGYNDHSIGFLAFNNACYLKQLYSVAYRYIREDEDIQHANVYTPGLRDHAQEGRDRLFSMLFSCAGKEVFIALTELAEEYSDERAGSRAKWQAYRRAELDADLPPWSPEQVREYELGQTCTPVTHRQLFDVAVDRLLDLKDWLEAGNTSQYKTWQRAENEDEMRNLIAGWLDDKANGRYSCAQENELPNAQRPDIWIQNPAVASPVPIELKILENWSGPELCERLRNQLAGDYLREITGGCGVMLLVWQGKEQPKRWRIDDKTVELLGLASALKDYWRSIANVFPGVHEIEVVMIDLTAREERSAT